MEEGGLKGERISAKGRHHHTWLRDWMALDSAAARARLCHMVDGVWEAGWRESFSARDSIIAYALGRGRQNMFSQHARHRAVTSIQLQTKTCFFFC